MKYYERFINKLETILTEEDFGNLKKETYFNKQRLITSKMKEILEGETDEFRQDFALNKEEYLVEACCHWEKLFNPLNPQQKMLVLVNCYCIYTLDKYNDKRTYYDSKVFMKALNDGEIFKYRVSKVGHLSDFINTLKDEGLTISDVMYWLQHEWRNLSGDYFSKQRGTDFISRDNTYFTARHYQAFNKMILEAFGKELKCIDKFNNTAVDDLKNALS